jgi:AAA+ ATPase superfamily predicted ATPase
MKKGENLFPVNRYIAPEYFCDREDETARLVSAVQNRVNTVILSNRRIGKTALIQNAFWHLEKKKVTTVYFDIMGTQSLTDFVKAFAAAVIGKVESQTEKILKQTLTAFASLRPQVSYDPLTGNPEVTVTLAGERETKHTLESIFNYLEKESKKKKIVVAIDEFQQIAEYHEKNVEALLRSRIQHLPNVIFFFSGSSKHLLSHMFGHPSKPFYASTQFLTLEKINPAAYSKFIRKNFERGKKKISESAVEYLLEWTRGITFYVQYICNLMYDSPHPAINEDIINQTILKIQSENEMLYYSFRNVLTSGQWDLLVALGKEAGIKNILSQDFIQRHKLSSTSSVKTALKALLEREMLIKEGEKYFVHDVFFSRWLERFS